MQKVLAELHAEGLMLLLGDGEEKSSLHSREDHMLH